MDIEYLKEFVCLCETCNYQEAAEMLHLSQPSLTKHIQKMEEELGVALFDRSTRNVSPSLCGKLFADFSREVISTYDSALTEVYALAETQNQHCVICGMPSLGLYGIVDTIDKFQRTYEGFRVDFVESNHVKEQLFSESCDFAFAGERAIINQKVKCVTYKQDRLAVILSRQHPLATENSLLVDQLKDERIIAHVNTDGSLTQEYLDFISLCEQRGFTPEFTAKVNHSYTLASMVSHNQGIAVSNSVQIPKDIPNICAVDIYPETPSNICMFYLRKHKMSAAAAAFLEYVEKSDKKTVEFL